MFLYLPPEISLAEELDTHSTFPNSSVVRCGSLLILISSHCSVREMPTQPLLGLLSPRPPLMRGLHRFTVLYRAGIDGCSVQKGWQLLPTRSVESSTHGLFPEGPFQNSFRFWFFFGCVHKESLTRKY
jgi:hypothetical protein